VIVDSNCRGCGYGDAVVTDITRVIMQPLDMIFGIVKGQQEGGAAKAAGELQRQMEQQQERASVTKYAIIGGAILASVFVLGLTTIKLKKKAA
jgi:hypothetical protein